MPNAPSSQPTVVETPFLDTIGARITLAGAGRALLELPYRDGNANRNGSLHGGVVAALIDVAAAAAADAAPAAARSSGASTIDFNVHFVAPAVREAVVAEATVTRRGRDISFVEVAVVTGARTIARGMVARRSGAASAGSRHLAGAEQTVAADAHAAGRPPSPASPLVALDDAAFVRRNVGSPFTMRLGVASALLAPGHAVALLPHADAILDDEGAVHEGAIATLVDCAGGAASWSVDGFDPSGRAATIGMHLCFDTGTRDESIAAEATTSWHQDGVYVSSITVAGRSSGRVLASGSVTYRIVRPTRAAR